MPPTFESLRRRLEVKQDGNIYADRAPTRWSNHDILPVPKQQWRYSALSYWAFWTICTMSVSGWSYGGSVVALGLSPGEGIGATVVATALVSVIAYLLGHSGATMHLGYTMLCRATFGLYGSYFAIMLLIFENLVFFGINAYFGGLAVVVMLSSWSHSFMHMKNSLPESAGITTQQLTGFLIYIGVFFSMLVIHPSKLNRAVLPVACFLFIAFFGLFGWAIGVNGGSPGNLLAPKVKLGSTTDRAFAMLYAICSAAGSTTGYATRIADWTRFAKTPRTPTLPMFIAIPISGTLCVVLGILATSAIYAKYEVIEWNPLALLLYIQAKHYTSACRAGTFFVGLAIFWSLLVNSLMSKAISSGLDLAGLWPKYITTRRGSVIFCVVGVVIQPWRFVTQSQTFLTVLSAFGVFIAPLAGILASDYWIVRKRLWKVNDLFKQDGAYWYWYGINWRAVIAYFVAFAPALPGFICSINGHSIAAGWIHAYDLCYIVGITLAPTLYYLFCLGFPLSGLGIKEEFDGTFDGKFTDAQVDALAAAEIGEKQDISNTHVLHVE